MTRILRPIIVIMLIILFGIPMLLGYLGCLMWKNSSDEVE